MSILNINGKFSTQISFKSANLDFFFPFLWGAQKHRNKIEWIQIQSKQQIRNMQENDIFLLKLMICPFFIQFSTFLRIYINLLFSFLGPIEIQ